MNFYPSNLEYLGTFIILFLLANSPKAKVRKTTTQAAMIASTGTPGTLSVGKANTGKSNQLLSYVFVIWTWSLIFAHTTLLIKSLQQPQKMRNGDLWQVRLLTQNDRINKWHGEILSPLLCEGSFWNMSTPTPSGRPVHFVLSLFSFVYFCHRKQKQIEVKTFSKAQRILGGLSEEEREGGRESKKTRQKGLPRLRQTGDMVGPKEQRAQWSRPSVLC